MLGVAGSVVQCHWMGYFVFLSECDGNRRKVRTCHSSVMFLIKKICWDFPDIPGNAYLYD